MYILCAREYFLYVLCTNHSRLFAAKHICTEDCTHIYFFTYIHRKWENEKMILFKCIYNFSISKISTKKSLGNVGHFSHSPLI